MNELTDVRIRVNINGKQTIDTTIKREDLLKRIQTHIGELRHLLPAYKKCILPEDNDKIRELCDELINEIPKMCGVVSGGITIDELTEQIDLITQAVLDYSALMDVWTGKEVKTIITIEE
jgi:hypothetical protein